ncbi:hypothetical protein F2Q70_00021934 [Brassica cretica]|uniref:Uncharacterized protein n=1 Tax=Brassica cretica TaxID=69181 RepID=A0A8S9GMG1_BRACR|nr:hypothetical protein F2Q70_00021934 [Brassica cretica]
MGSSFRHNSAHLRDIKGKGILYEDDDAPMFWSLFRVVTGSGYRFELVFQFRRFEVNQHPVTEVMLVLLKSGQSVSREEAVEEMKDCRSTKQHWCRSTISYLELVLGLLDIAFISS